MTAILITRPQPDADAFAQLCRDAGLSPVLSPLMETVIGSADVDLHDVGALAFTSANGVRAFAANVARRDLPVFSVGSATAGAAKAAGFQDVSIADGEVGSLADLIARRAPEGVTVHIAGTRRSGDLIALLHEKHISARRIVLYEMREATTMPRPAIELLKARASNAWVTLFSPRTTVLFMHLAHEARIENTLRDCRAACLSDAVADLLPRENWAQVIVARARDAQSMIDGVKSAS